MGYTGMMKKLTRGLHESANQKGRLIAPNICRVKNFGTIQGAKIGAKIFKSTNEMPAFFPRAKNWKPTNHNQEELNFRREKKIQK